MAKSKLKTPTFRIQTGALKGQMFLLPPLVDETVRPSKNKVLQAGFNMLESRTDLAAARFLDVCTGSGQWALEALSRGAEVTALDTQTATVAANAKNLSAELQARLTITKTGLETFQPAQAYDVIFCDPPYAQTNLYQKLLTAPHWLVESGFLLLELDKKAELNLPNGWEDIQRKTYGHSILWLLQRQ